MCVCVCGVRSGPVAWTFAQENREREEVTELPSGLQYEVLRKGAEEMLHANWLVGSGSWWSGCTAATDAGGMVSWRVLKSPGCVRRTRCGRVCVEVCPSCRHGAPNKCVDPDPDYARHASQPMGTPRHSAFIFVAFLLSASVHRGATRPVCLWHLWFTIGRATVGSVDGLGKRTVDDGSRMPALRQSLLSEGPRGSHRRSFPLIGICMGPAWVSSCT